MRRVKSSIIVFGAFILIFYCGISSDAYSQAKTSTKTKQTTTKTKQPVKSNAVTTKTVPTKKPVVDATVVVIGTQRWAKANLDVITFSNGDTIPEAKTYKEWVAAGDAGKPAWCYYNNDAAIGKKYGKLYNWYAVNDERGLAPKGWSLPNDEDWSKLASFLGGSGAAGVKMKSTTGWSEGNNGSNESGFNGFPGGYRVENGLFMNLGSIGIWWSTKESRTDSADDYYLVFGGSLATSSNPKQRGASVRCLKK